VTCPPCSCYRAPLLCLRPRARAAVPAGGLDLRLRTSRSVFERFDLQAVIARLTPLSRGSPHDRDPSCVTPLPNVFDDEARRAATLLFAIRHPLPRRSLGGVQLPDGAPGGDRTLAVGGMPLSVLCSRFDCQRAPFDSSRRLAPPGTSPVAERRGLKAPSVAPSEPRAFRHGWLFAQTSARLLSSPAPFDSTRTPVFRRALLRRCRRSRTRQTISSTTHHAAPSKARAPSPPALRHPRQAVMMRTPKRRTNPASSGTTPRHPRSWFSRSPVSRGPSPCFTRFWAREPGCRSSLSRVTTAEAVQWFYPTRCIASALAMVRTRATRLASLSARWPGAVMPPSRRKRRHPARPAESRSQEAPRR
jgi:hypothetical protein